MNRSTAQRKRELVGGTARIFASEALLIPTGIATAVFLSRRFGPDGYGLLTLASVLIVWVETNVAAALARPTIKLVGDADEWRPFGDAALRLYLLAGCILATIVWAIAPALGALLNEPQLAGYLRLMALDVPVFCAAQAHRSIIVGLSRFRGRAAVSAVRWVARLLLIVVFVTLGRSPSGAVWGIICASLVELVVCRFYVRPQLFRRGAYPLRRLCVYALPLVASALCMSLYSRLDLIMLKALGGTTAEAGVYGVAQNLSLLPTLFSYAFAPALLSILSRALRDGDEEAARDISRQAMRGVLLLLPFAAAVAGAAPDIIRLVFGDEFIHAAPLMGLLMFGSIALLLIAVTTCIMTAAGKLKWTLHVAWPLVLCAGAGHLLFIPRYGAHGAAFVTTACACATALVTIGLVRRLWQIAPPARTFRRVVIICPIVYALLKLWPADEFMLVLKLTCAGIFIALALLLSGEFSADEINSVRACFDRRRPDANVEVPGEL